MVVALACTKPPEGRERWTVQPLADRVVEFGIVEIDPGILSGQCLDRRVPDREPLELELAAWVATRNSAVRSIDWRFTTDDARIKRDHLYPVFHA